MLQFTGEISSSKSLFNRALIVQSFYSDIKIEGYSKCDDVIHMQNALEHLKDANEFYCGDGGTTFRFLAIRLSRNKGVYEVRGSKRLMERPHEELFSIFKQLEIKHEINQNGIKIISEGWKFESSKTLHLHLNKTSQYASAVVLSAWNLPFDLRLSIDGNTVSEDYWKMTLNLVKDFGMSVLVEGTDFVIPKQQKSNLKSYRVESDLSSIFCMAVAGVLSGRVEVKHFPIDSTQPDREFLNIFNKMNIKYSINKDSIQFVKHSAFSGIEVDIKDAPDLFPVLSVLCAFASSPSILFNASHLIYKESNRLAKISELFKLVHVRHDILDDGIVIYPTKIEVMKNTIVFDPENDHRLAMAAGILKKIGYPIKIMHPEVVNKSFPEFWNCIRIDP